MLDDEEQILSQAITDKKLAYMRKDDHLQEGIIANSTVIEDQQILLPHKIPIGPLNRNPFIDLLLNL